MCCIFWKLFWNIVYNIFVHLIIIFLLALFLFILRLTYMLWWQAWRSWHVTHAARTHLPALRDARHSIAPRAFPDVIISSSFFYARAASLWYACIFCMSLHEKALNMVYMVMAIPMVWLCWYGIWWSLSSLCQYSDACRMCIFYLYVIFLIFYFSLRRWTCGTVTSLWYSNFCRRLPHGALFAHNFLPHSAPARCPARSARANAALCGSAHACCCAPTANRPTPRHALRSSFFFDNAL